MNTNTFRLLAIVPIVVLFLVGCASTPKSIGEMRADAARHEVRIDPRAEVQRVNEVPVYIDGDSIREWLSQGGYSVKEENAQDKMFAALSDLFNHTQGFYTWIPAGRDGRPELRARGNQASAEGLRLPDGSYPLYVEVSASEALRRQPRILGWQRDRRDGGSAWVDVSIRLLAYDGSGWREVAAGHGDDDWKSFLVRPFKYWGRPYDPVYESAIVAIAEAYEDLLAGLDTAYWADVERR